MLMPENNTRPQNRGKSRRERIEHARSRDILDVADELGMELFKDGRDYRWKEHDSLVISPDKNLWNWFSEHSGGDVIALVETQKKINFNQAIDFLNDGSFREYDSSKRVEVREPFSYYLQPYEQPFSEARAYLKEQRGLSDETIDFFLEKGVLAQANAMLNDSIEPVVVFKTLSSSGEVVGASVQGIQENWEKWPKRGYAKRILRNSDEMNGLHVDIGEPKRLVFTESPIDLMSYYELHKEALQDVRLVSMDGIKGVTIGRHLVELETSLSNRVFNWTQEQLEQGLETAIKNGYFADGKHADMITLAVDNDETGRKFVQKLQDEGATITADLPELELREEQEKMDWNEFLKQSNQPISTQVHYNVEEIALDTENFTEVLTAIQNYGAKPILDPLAYGEPLKNLIGESQFDELISHNLKPVFDFVSKHFDFPSYDEYYGYTGTNLNHYQQFEDKLEYFPITEVIEKAKNEGMWQELQDRTNNLEETAPQPGEQGAFFENLVDVTSNKELPAEPQLQVVFDFSENKRIAENYSNGDVIPYQDFISKLYEENEWQLIIPEQGYDKTYFALEDEKGNRLIQDFRYDIGSEKQDLSEQLAQTLPAPYLALAKKADRDYHAQISYSTFKADLKNLTKAVESQIQAGSLNVSLSDEAYFYTLVNYTGWSHPMQQLKPEALEALKKHRSFFESINDTNIDRFKEKGTPEQNQMYTILKELQKELGRSNTSTIFSEEVAISAYNLNRGLNSLTAENWRQSNTDPIGTLGRDTWNILSYPANEIVNGNEDYYFQLVPYHLLEFLNGKTGTVEISPKTYENILQQLRDEAVVIQPDEITEEYKKAPEISQEQNKKERTNVSKGSLQLETEGSAVPVLESSTFEQTVTSHPTLSSHLLYFTTENTYVSNIREGYHVIDDKDLGKLNNFAPMIQETANWYRNTLAESDLLYFVKNGNDTDVIRLTFKSSNFAHLTGILPVCEQSSSAKILNDFADGKGHFDNILIGNQKKTFTKLGVLPNIKSIINPKSFYFEDLEDIKRFKRMDVSKAIRSDDEDILLAFRTVENSGEVNSYPATLLKVKGGVKTDIESKEGKVILGIYRERDGQLEQLSINQDYVKDGGKEMMDILKNRQYEPVEPVQENTSSPVEEYSYKTYDEVRRGAEPPIQDQYHVHLHWSERRFGQWAKGAQLPFENNQLVDYRTFVTELYKLNQEYYQPHMESIKLANPVTNEGYIPYTKTKFSIHAPDGQLIDSDVRYDIAEETEPITRMLSSASKRNFPELVRIDEAVFFQLENQNLNQEIAREANAPQEVTPTVSNEQSVPNSSFVSPKQELKDNLAKRVEEILGEERSTNIEKSKLIQTLPEIQEILSTEGNLIENKLSNGQIFYTKTISFGNDYQLELAIYSSHVVESLSDEQAPWSLQVLKNSESLGYLAYGSDWGSDFQIEDELHQLVNLVNTDKITGNLYPQEEVSRFLDLRQKQGSSLLFSLERQEIFDYYKASARELSEIAFQKIREYTQSPEDLKEYLDFMSQFPQLSPRNVALIQAQWPGANAVATFDQWQALGESLGIEAEDVMQTKATYTNKRTGESKEVTHDKLSVKMGETSKITLFRPIMSRMIPVLDQSGQQRKNDKGNLQFKPLKEATAEEKALVKQGKLKVSQFPVRDSETGQPKFTTYKVFELSQTTLKPEAYPKAMPNRHYNFNMDQVKTKEVMAGLCDYAQKLGVTLLRDEAHLLGNAAGAFSPLEQTILLNPDNSPGEQISTTIHELAHATLHNPKFTDQYKEDVSTGRKELEAEMTSYLVSQHFGLDTSEKAVGYMAQWTNNLQALDDRQLMESIKRIHKTVSQIVTQVEHHTKPYQPPRNRGKNPNFSQGPVKGPKL